jgi:hypothetical protein
VHEHAQVWLGHCAFEYDQIPRAVSTAQAPRRRHCRRSSSSSCTSAHRPDPVNGGRASGAHSVGPRRSPTTPYQPRPRSLPTGPTPALPAATSTKARRRSVSMSARRCLARGLLGDIRAVRAEQSDPGRTSGCQMRGLVIDARTGTRSRDSRRTIYQSAHTCHGGRLNRLCMTRGEALGRARTGTAARTSTACRPSNGHCRLTS